MRSYVRLFPARPFSRLSAPKHRNGTPIQAVLHISVMQSFFSGKGHEPARCEKLRKETTKLRSQILQYDPNATFDHAGANGGGGGGGGGGRVAVVEEKTTAVAKKIGDYCIACELARLFKDMFSTEGEESETLDYQPPFVPRTVLTSAVNFGSTGRHHPKGRLSCASCPPPCSYLRLYDVILAWFGSCIHATAGPDEDGGIVGPPQTTL